MTGALAGGAVTFPLKGLDFVMTAMFVAIFTDRNVLPVAVFAMLVVYCYRNVTFTSGNHGLPELIAGAVTAALHLWKKNMMLSIAAGTVLYMLLVQFVF